MGHRERYLSLTEDEIAAMVLRGEPETLHLEFKCVEREDFSARGDRKTLAQAISGLANADGGLVIWGVDARKGPDNVDCAQQERPLQDPRLFLSRVTALTSEAASPAVDGVEHRIIERRAGGAFAVSLVPVSDSGPHMAKLGEDRYYKRSGDSFLRMEQFEVEDMFGRRRRPVLTAVFDDLRFDVRMPQAGGPLWRFNVRVSIVNSGRGSARAPYLALTHGDSKFPDPHGLDGNGREGLPRLISSGMPGWTAYGATMDAVIHPATRLDVTKMRIQFAGYPPPITDICVGYHVGAEGIRIVEGECRMTEDAFRRLLPTD